jgi:DNA primase
VVFRVVSSQTEALTRQIQQASDILEVVSQFVALKPAGASHKGLCPFHTEKTPSFSVNPSRLRSGRRRF